MELSPKCRRILDVLSRSEMAMPLSVGDLVDVDFCTLIEGDLMAMVQFPNGFIAGRITGNGRDALVVEEARDKDATT